MRLASLVTAMAMIGLAQNFSGFCAEIPSEPGFHTGVPLPGHSADVNDSGQGSNSYELYLPNGYGKAKDVRHPLVIVQGNGATANKNWIEERHLPDWAEGLSPPAIIVGVNRLFNAGVGVGFGSSPNKPKIPGEEGLNDYWRLVDKLPHAHPTMRFLISWPSGGGGDSQRVTALSLKAPEKIAGYVLSPHPYAFRTAGGNEAFKLKQDISVAVLNVTHEAYARGRPETPYAMDSGDRFDPLLWDRAYLVHLRRGGNPFRLIESIDWGLREPSIQEALSYLVQSGWQVKKGVTAVEREAGKLALLKTAVEAAELKDVSERERRYRSLLAVPGVAEWAEAKETLETWRKLVPQAADRRQEPLFQAFYLEAMQEHPLIKDSPATADRVAEKLAELQSTRAYQREFAARKAVRTAAAKFNTDQLIGQNVAGLEGTISAFQDALRISEGTLSGKEAVAWLDFLTKRRERNSKSGSRTERNAGCHGPGL